MHEPKGLPVATTKSEKVAGVLPRLRQVKDHFGWNDSELASAMGLSRSYVSRLFSGDRKAVPLEATRMLEAKHRVSSAWMVTGSGEMMLPGGNTMERGSQPVVMEGSSPYGTPPGFICTSIANPHLAVETLRSILEACIAAGDHTAAGTVAAELARRTKPAQPFKYPTPGDPKS